MLATRTMHRLAFAIAGATAIASAILACGSTTVTTPSYVAQPQSALAEVPYPPPPARVEFVPDKPDDDAVWIDGEWIWRGRRYAWKPGRWVKPVQGGAYAPWTTVRDAMGTLFLAKGAWRDPKGAELPDPAPILVGAQSQGTVVDPEGEQIPSTPPQPAADPGAPDGALPPGPLEAGAPDSSIIPEGGAGPSDVYLVPVDAMPLDTKTDAP
jgi:hypothetical protein